MKKKLLLTLFMVAMLTCVFAITAFAEDIIVSKTESEEYGTVIQLNADPGLDNASQYVSTLKNINDSGKDTDALCILTDGTYFYVFPSSYIVWEINGGKFEIYAGTETNAGLAQAMAEFNAAMGTSYYADYAIVSTWGNRRLDEVVRFEFTSDVTWVDRDHCCMRSYPNLTEVRINHQVKFARARSMFSNCKKLKAVVGFENVTNLTSDTSTFFGCSALESIKLPTDIDKIPGSMFWGCTSLKSIENLSELTSLTTIGASAFQDSLNLVITLPDSITTIESSAFQSAVKNKGSITINPTSKLTSIGSNAFRDCRALKSLYIPSTVTSIGTNAFRQTFALTALENFENCQITELGADTFYEATALKSIKLPKTLTTIDTAFYKNENLALVYIPSSVISIADTFTGDQPANAVYVFTGKDASVLSACTRLSGANKISANEYVEGNTYTGVNFVVGYSDCIVYNNGVHTDKVVDTEVSTYLEVIKIVNKCTTCGMAEESGEIPALFECLGYSAPENGVGGITVGYLINDEAIAEYTSISGKTVNYGVFVVSNKIGTDDVVNASGELINGALGKELSAYSNDAFEIKITGFKDTQKDEKFAIGAFVITTDGENTVISYMQEGTPTEGAKYEFVSFNDIVGGTVA